MKSQNFEFDIEAYNKMPQYFKLQYKFPKGYSKEYIIKDISKQCKKAQLETAKIRKIKNKHYNKRQSLDFWLNQEYPLKEAKDKLEKDKKENSPLCKEFYIKRNISDYDNIINKIRVDGAHSALKKASKPQTEKIIESILIKNDINYKSQFKISYLDHKQKNKSYIYDFLMCDFNTVIRCNGNYWHANPKIYEKNHMFKFPGGKKVLANEIWKKDEHKNKILMLNGYDFLIFWEDEINKEAKNIELKIMEHICAINQI
jgi:G:T-mismatch repair DNA endonuclease (very short patch repair protein)